MAGTLKELTDTVNWVRKLEDKFVENEEVIVMPESEKESNRGVILAVVKTAALTLCGIFAFFCLLISSLAVFSPLSLAKVTGEIGIAKVSATMYERQYNKTGKLSDLYNAIEAMLICENYSGAARLIKVMRTRPGYADFCDSVNNSAIEASSKEKWVYVANYDAYLRSQLTKSLYKSGQTAEAEEFAINELMANSNIYAWEFGAFIDCVLDNNYLSQDQKNAKLKLIYESEYDGSIIDELINNNLDMLEDPDSQEGIIKLQTLYQMIKIKTTFRLVKVASGVDGSAEASDIGTLLNKYDAALAAI